MSLYFTKIIITLIIQNETKKEEATKETLRFAMDSLFATDVFEL